MTAKPSQANPSQSKSIQLGRQAQVELSEQIYMWNFGKIMLLTSDLLLVYIFLCRLGGRQAGQLGMMMIIYFPNLVSPYCKGAGWVGVLQGPGGWVGDGMCC